MNHNKLIILSFTLFLIGVEASYGQDILSENRFGNSSIALKKKIEFYPNPAVDFLILEIDNSNSEKLEFEMHSLIGNQIKIQAEEIGYGKYRIPVKNFEPGYYFVVVEDKKTSEKFAVKWLKGGS